MSSNPFNGNWKGWTDKTKEGTSDAHRLQSKKRLESKLSILPNKSHLRTLLWWQFEQMKQSEEQKVSQNLEQLSLSLSLCVAAHFRVLWVRIWKNERNCSVECVSTFTFSTLRGATFSDAFSKWDCHKVVFFFRSSQTTNNEIVRKSQSERKMREEKTKKKKKALGLLF